MSLTDRFQQLRGGTQPAPNLDKAPAESDVAPLAAAPATLGRILEAKTAAELQTDAVEVQQTASVASEALNALKERASQALFERLGGRITDSSIEEAELHQSVKDELKVVLEEEQIPLTATGAAAPHPRNHRRRPGPRTDPAVPGRPGRHGDHGQPF